jgi:enoyl-CoA hydratase/carnithine racemase
MHAMIDCINSPPWPEATMVLLLDDLGDVSLEDLSALEQRKFVTVAAVNGSCTGVGLAAALAVDLLVASPKAAFGQPGNWTDIVIRRGKGIAGRKIIAYLAMTRRLIDAECARKLGIVTTIHENPIESARELAEQISARSPIAVETVLKQCHRGAVRDYIDTRFTGKIR